MHISIFISPESSQFLGKKNEHSLVKVVWQKIDYQHTSRSIFIISWINIILNIIYIFILLFIFDFWKKQNIIYNYLYLSGGWIPTWKCWWFSWTHLDLVDLYIINVSSTWQHERLAIFELWCKVKICYATLHLYICSFSRHRPLLIWFHRHRDTQWTEQCINN